MSQNLRPISLAGVLKTYPWGKPAKESLITFLMPGQAPSDDTPCAELWFGAHSSGPALTDAGDLREIIRTAPHRLLGARVIEKLGGELPYLFKILTIGRPLSIQAHPDKKMAKTLHQQDPKNYPDPNHKPEVALALSEVRVLMGFRPFGDVALDLSKFPCCVKALAEAENAENPLKHLMHWLCQLSELERGTVFQEVRSRLALADSLSAHEVLALNVSGYFGEEDIGILLSFLLNIVSVPPGEAIFTPPNTPHAYLSGTLVECMAPSDNVVRGGLTNKFVDRETLLRMLDYRPLTPSLVRKQSLGEGHTRLNLPVDEFALEDFENDEALESRAIQPEGPHLIFCLRGEGSLEYLNGTVHFKRGAAFLIPAELGPYALKIAKGRVFRVSVP